MDDLAAEAETLAREEAEQQRLAARLSRAEAELEEASERVMREVDRVAEEQADVDRLESLSPTRVLAVIRGSRDGDLERERAEAERAAYDLARARAARDLLQEEVRHLRARLQTLGDVVVRREDLRRRVSERAVRTNAPAATELARLSQVIGELGDQQREVDEALAAAGRAQQALDAAAELLGSAQSWSTYDTFFGGGIIGDAVKYDRLERAQALMRRADEAIDGFRRELADVGGGAVGGIDVGLGDRIFDLWFDHVLGDWQVRRRIGEAADRVQSTRQRVHQASDQLRRRARDVEERLRVLRAERAVLVEQTLG